MTIWRLGLQLITSQRDGVIYVVLEYGDIDLARRLAQQEAKRRATAGALRPENFIRQTWEEMLEVRRCDKRPPFGAASRCRTVQAAAGPSVVGSGIASHLIRTAT